MTLNPQRRVDDASNLDTVLPSGRTVRDVCNSMADWHDVPTADAWAIVRMPAVVRRVWTRAQQMLLFRK